MISEKKKLSIHKKWPYIFYAMAFIDFFVIFLFLYKNQLQYTEYGKIADLNKKEILILNLSKKLIDHSKEMNAPGNDIFESNNIIKESRRFELAKNSFNRSLSDIKLILLKDPFDPSYSIYSQQIDLIKKISEEIVSFSEVIFQKYNTNKPGEAGIYMAKMDRTNSTLLSAIEEMRSFQVKLQSENVNSHQKILHQSREIGKYFSLFIIFLIFSIVFYGFKVSKFLKDTWIKDFYLAQIVSTSTDAIITINLETKILSWNKSAEVIFGYSKEEILENDFSKLFAEESKSDCVNIIDEIKKTHSIGNYLTKLINKNGNFIVVSLSATLIQNETKSHLISIIMRDVTEKEIIKYNFSQVFQALNKSSIVAYTDEKGKIIDLNENFSRISGYSRQELIGKDHRIINSNYHPKDFFKIMWQKIKNGETWIGEIKNKNKNGSYYWVQTVIAPIFKYSGEIEKFISIRFDITAQKNAEISLLDKANQMQKLIDGVPAAISHWNKNLINLAANNNYLKHFNINNQNNIIGMHFSDVVSPIISDIIRPHIENVLSGAKTSFQTEYVNHEGETLYYQETFNPDRENGEVKGFFSVSIDITKQKLLEVERLKIANELELERVKSYKNAKLASLGEISAGIAHEINNPLAIINGSLDLLIKFKDNEKKFNEKVESIKKSCSRISKIILGLKKFSRTSQREVYSPSYIDSILNEVISLIEFQAKKHFVSLTLENLVHTQILCHEIEIEQVFVNLINNSIDAIKHQKEKWIKISMSVDKENVIIRLMDSGKGIPLDLQSKIFEPFFTTKNVGEGTGLGLSISKGIIDEHKGSITILNDLPNTCFEIKFHKYYA